jgi:DNA polymerase-3 subunit gamma/tau
MVQTLRNAFASGRIAHGFMLTGVRGVGKTTTARILARALNYETDTINQPTIDMPVLGRHCAEIMESRHPDVIEMDAASNTGVDNIREIIESARYRPMTARTKVFIIDEVHMLSKGAFNALLKTLEEPPGHVKFIFATTEVRKVPVTVLSRCQRFDLRRVDVPRLAQHLENIVGNEGASADDDALVLIARAAEGSVRDALSILDQAISTSLGAGDTVTATSVRAMLGLADRGRVFDLLDMLVTGDIAQALKALDALSTTARTRRRCSRIWRRPCTSRRASKPSGRRPRAKGSHRTRSGARARSASVSRWRCSRGSGRCCSRVWRKPSRRPIRWLPPRWC